MRNIIDFAWGDICSYSECNSFLQDVVDGKTGSIGQSTNAKVSVCHICMLTDG